MIKVKHPLNIEVLKVLASGAAKKCIACKYHSYGATKHYCRVIKNELPKQTTTCGIFTRKVLDSITYNIFYNNNQCNPSCKYYLYLGLDGFCVLFSKELPNNQRCRECIDLHKGSYI